MYFSLLPDVQYDLKPIEYPFSRSEFVRVKNFFTRYTVSEDIFSVVAFFKKYSINDGIRLDQVAEATYGDPLFDWVIALTNGMIDPLFDWPKTTNEMNRFLLEEFDDAYGTIRHYEVVSNDEQLSRFGQVLIKGGTKVDETYYSGSRVFNINGTPTTVVNSSYCKSVTIADYEQELNEKKREIYLLKPRYLNDFVSEFRKTNLYSKSNSFISTKLKKSGV